MKAIKTLVAVIITSLFLSGCFLIGNVKETGRRDWEHMTAEQIRTVPLQEVVDHLRYDYGTYECPQKSDRLFIPEDVWQQIDWTKEEKYRNAALPHKLWNMRHDDYNWPSCHGWRGDNAKGPRAGVGHDKYFPPLPQLVEGRGIARWMTVGDTSILEIPLFKDYEVTWTTSTIPNEIEVIERRKGNPNDGKTFTITKEYLLRNYAPSPLQKFSDKSYLEVYPYHKSYHIMLNKNENIYGEGPDDDVYFWRYGWRWDSYDSYYIKGAFFVGGHWN